VSPLIVRADAFHIPLAFESVQMVVTSPCYYRLRKYAGHTDDAFGWEKTVALYVRNTLKILREIRRVLRSDGVVFWIVCDTYYGSNRGRGSRSKVNPYCEPSPLLGQGLAKCLCLIPDQIRLAARNDGWIVRSNIIWSKPNCIPESVKDRCAHSYEDVIMLTRQGSYSFNTAEAVEPSVCWQKGTWGSAEKSLMNRRAKLQLTMRDGNKVGCSKTAKKSPPIVGNRILRRPTRNLRDVWSIPTHAHPDDHVAIFPEALAERCIRIGSRPGDAVLDCFAGSGTTGVAAERLGRRAILMDISEEYCQLMMRKFAREDAISADDERLEG
jgi:DNA modification methylase